MDEFRQKLQRLRRLMTKHRLDALWLRRISSFAWLTGGAASFVNTAAEYGAASILVTPERAYLLTNNIEAPRLLEEEGLAEGDLEPHISPWHTPADAVQSLIGEGRLGTDGPWPGAVDLSGPIAWLRSQLLPPEQERFRELGQRCAAAMQAAVARVRPGMREYEIAALLAEETLVREVWPIVNLIATDERVFRYRHPLPTGKRLERYAMLVLCGRWRGLVCSITRLVHFGPLPESLERKAQAVAQVDATLIAATRPGVRLGDVFQRGVAAYAATGFPDEWQHHHQGGVAGYESRERKATPTSEERVVEGQVYAWNPSIAGTKSEDSVLVGATENEVLTVIPGWPTIPVTVGEMTIERPAIWVWP